MSMAFRERLVGLKMAGHPWTEVLLQMRNQGCNAHIRTLKRIWSRYKQTRQTEPGQSPVRPPVCSERGVRRVIRTALRDRRHSYMVVAKELKPAGIDVSATTVKRILAKAGFSRHGQCARPALNARQRRSRLAWALAHRHWKVCHWGRVIFSDEKIFKSRNDMPRGKVTRKRGDRLKKDCILRTMKGGPQVHAWGCIGWRGVGPIRKVNGRLNAAKYQTDIIFDVENIGRRLALKRYRRFVFQQDKAPPHRARSTLNLLAQKGVEVLDWPGNSPVVNPLEHAWAYVSKLLSKNPPPRNELEYWESIKRAWGSIPLKVVRSLISSLPRRVQAIVSSRGDYTRY